MIMIMMQKYHANHEFLPGSRSRPRNLAKTGPAYRIAFTEFDSEGLEYYRGVAIRFVTDHMNDACCLTAGAFIRVANYYCISEKAIPSDIEIESVHKKCTYSELLQTNADDLLASITECMP